MNEFAAHRRQKSSEASYSKLQPGLIRQATLAIAEAGDPCSSSGINVGDLALPSSITS